MSSFLHSIAINLFYIKIGLVLIVLRATWADKASGIIHNAMDSLAGFVRCNVRMYSSGMWWRPFHASKDHIKRVKKILTLLPGANSNKNNWNVSIYKQYEIITGQDSFGKLQSHFRLLPRNDVCTYSAARFMQSLKIFVWSKILFYGWKLLKILRLL